MSLVTIGIPAYNRPEGLDRAVRSVLAQDHPELEVIISDDASGDPAVAETGARLAAEDPRVRFFRQPRNLGHAGNYQWVLEAGSGEHFMWLADDDWIDPQYVRHCLAALRADPAAVLVCGLASYYRDGAYVGAERAIDLDSPRPGIRLIRYFARVSLNGPLFGVARRQDLLAVGFPQVVGGDWLLIAALAARGSVRTLGDVHIHRSMTGLGSDTQRLVSSFGMQGVAARHHHLVAAARIWRDIATGAPAFRSMTPAVRACVGTTVAALIVMRFSLTSLARVAMGSDNAASIERRISAWLRKRDVAARE